MSLFNIKLKQKGRCSHGFTLIEFIMYMAIGSIILGAMSFVSLNVVYGSIKQQAISEVAYNAQYIFSTIEDISRRADTINYPEAGTTAELIILSFLDADLNPTSLFVEEGTMYLTQRETDKKPLTTQRVLISDFEITHIVTGNDLYTFSISFHLAAKNDGPFSEYQFSDTYYSTFTLRK